MGTKGTTSMPITAIVQKGKKKLFESGNESYVKADKGVITTAAGNMPIETRPDSYLFNNSPKSPIDGSGGGSKKGGK
tara:strand:- start:247 stop:477 length:231 start_codon:yes stop_codon:yes gene_type:complete